MARVDILDLSPTPISLSTTLSLKWCSWCYEQNNHQLVSKNFLARNDYRCQGCGRLTCRCTACEHMCRNHGVFADKLCAHCDFSLSQWGSPPPASSTVAGWCSWCFSHGTHSLNEKSFVSRNVYRCCACEKPLVRCRLCSEGLARVHTEDNLLALTDQLCALCDHTVPEWGSPEAQRAHVAWCSWCVQFSTHRLSQANLMRRNVYTCGSCLCRTLFCLTCSDGMCRGGEDWDDNTCSRCRWELHENWEEHRRLVAAAIALTSECDSLHEMSRRSEFRTQADENGLLRCFLLIVSMDLSTINLLACLLEISVLTDVDLLDRHAAASAILNHPKGLLSRCKDADSRFSPNFLHKYTWYHILQFICRNVLKGKSDFCEPFSDEDALKFSQMPHDASMRMVEELVLCRLCDMQSLSMGLDCFRKLEKEATTEKGGRLQKSLIRVGLADVRVTCLALGLIQRFRPGWDFSFDKVAGSDDDDTTTQMVCLVSPADLSSWLWFGKQVVATTVGHSFESVFMVLMYILHQHIVLGLRGIDVSTYQKNLRDKYFE